MRYVKSAWNATAEKALCDGVAVETRDGIDHLVSGVSSGRMLLYHVDNRSWLVIEPMGKMLFIWSFAGFNCRHLMRDMLNVARRSGMVQVSFFTRHRSVLRMYRMYGVYALPRKAMNEPQYVIDVPKEQTNAA